MVRASPVCRVKADAAVMTKRSKWLTLAQVVEQIMKNRGMTEEEARQELLRALRSGELTAWGVPVRQDGPGGASRDRGQGH